ncbi:MAG: NAD-dependent epimerase/dehydratase family protein [Xanthomonadales bacterium]|nr:NAD-dependent epimerase/dehydratase family protein [Xanthomonadales bacterium]
MTRSDSVLVLGSAGFLGSAIVQGLAAAGNHVLALGRSEQIGESDGVVRMRGSIEDGAQLQEALGRCDRIIYCASLTTPGTSARDPALEVLGNLLPLARVIECAHDFPACHLVYLSSGGTVYGDGGRDAVESTPLRPRSYYGAAKIGAEALLHACAATSDWRVTVLRPTNPYGPGQAIAKAFAVVPTLFQRAIDGARFPIWGDGSAVRDYCYVDDLVGAVLATLAHEHGGDQDRFRVFNVSSGDAVSVVELLRLCEQASARRIEIEFLPARSVDVAHVSPSHAALSAATGWRPSVPLGEGLARTWRWIEAVRAAAGNR